MNEEKMKEMREKEKISLLSFQIFSFQILDLPLGLIIKKGSYLKCPMIFSDVHVHFIMLVLDGVKHLVNPA
jgi:hypothetical protein